MEGFLVGGITVASLIVGLFFLRFWIATKDSFFLLFALSFWIDGLHRIAIHYFVSQDATSPVHYLPRLLAYALIIAAIAQKNRKT
jgi:Family of unknown function (DUF5985)